MIGKNWLVILLTKNSMQLVGLGEEKVQTLAIPGTIISNMEVTSKDGLYTLITNWLGHRPHTGAEIIWILAPDICFEHVITSTEQAKIDSETLQFLDTVPFEEVLSRVYKRGKQRFSYVYDPRIYSTQLLNEGSNTGKSYPSRRCTHSGDCPERSQAC